MERRSNIEIVTACVAAWAVPGAGHFYLGRKGRGAIFLVCVLAMFVLGLALQGELFVLSFSDFFAILKFFADVGVGVSYFIARGAGLGQGVMDSATFDYGNVFLYGAGLLNMLIVLDAFDIAMGRKR